jgi:RimJ/RimL family protein N-acetyltransferase
LGVPSPGTVRACVWGRLGTDRLNRREVIQDPALQKGDSTTGAGLRSRVVDEIVIYLQMTSPGQLVPGRAPPAPVEAEEVGPAEAPAARATYAGIGASLGWAGRMDWSDAQWEQELLRPRGRAWIARVDDQVAGFVELEAEPNGDVGIVVFGLVPEFVGMGFGAAFLTLATRFAWTVMSSAGRTTRRVWVQTSSDDHPHALPNYEGRGLRRFRALQRPRTPQRDGRMRHSARGCAWTAAQLEYVPLRALGRLSALGVLVGRAGGT